MPLIWDKGGDPGPDERVMRFLSGRDIVLDAELFPYDIVATRAHADGLARIGVLSAAERKSIAKALDELLDESQRGSFVLDDRYEDGHSAIEAYLTEKLGEVGKKVHTGRSRNDQVLVATRLFLRDALETLENTNIEIASICLERAELEVDTPMPGYTHLQRAVPSSAGMWFAGFAEAFIDNAALARTTRRWINASPLGTAAGYGVNLPLDRDGVAHDLGFNRLQLNPIYAQNSRGKFEFQVMSAFAQAMLDLRRLAWDLSLYTSAEFDFIRLPKRYTTGSSIMPNKSNPDVVELLRASYAPVQGAMAELQSLLSLPSGYHRDLQFSKEPVMRAVAGALEALGLLPDLVRSMDLNRARMREAIDAGMYATDRAVELTAEGVPFREAYRRVAAESGDLSGRTPEESLAARISPGAAADLRLDILRDRLDELS
ncbi:MAG: argininosuccinate lyase [Phycisphaerales bacterium]